MAISMDSSWVNETAIRAQARLLEMAASHDSLDALLNALVLFVEGFAPNMRCSILLADLKNGVLKHGAAPHLPPHYVHAIDGLPIADGVGSCGTAAARRQLVIVDDIASSALWRGYEELAADAGLAACWSSPLLDSKEQLLGTCAMYYATRRAPTPMEIDLIRVAGSLASIVIQRFRDTELLRTNELRYRELAETCPDAILAHVEGRFVYVNRAAALLLDGNAEELLRQHRLGDFALNDSRNDLLGLRTGVMATLLKGSDGSTRHVEIAATKTTIDGEQATLLVIRDVTRRVTLENELFDAESRQQEHLAYDLHDGLGQQLTGLSLLLRSLGAAVLPALPSVTKEFEDISALVTKSISDIRTLANSMSPVTVERAGLTGALMVLRDKAENVYGLSATLAIEPFADRLLDNVVANHLFRIVQEAVGNAARHARATEVRISARPVRSELVITVSDNGIGISAASVQTAGLGLRSMRYRTERIGGKIRVERCHPHGTLVEVTCPLVQGAGKMHHEAIAG